MFKKKPAIKSLSPLKSSERRRTADSIIKDFQLEIKAPESSAENAESKAAEIAAHTALRNSILPENSLSAKFTTTVGPHHRQVTGTVFSGSHVGNEQRILWVKLEGKLYPTVYTLWHNPGIVPLLHTPSFVVTKLKGGADLMTPGLAGPPFPAKAKKNAIVAIASLEAPSVPVAVGFCEIDVSALEQVQGVKGHAVQIIHCDGDELWAWSPVAKPGLPTPEFLEGWDVHNDDRDLTTGTQSMSINDAEAEDEGGVALTGHDESVEPNDTIPSTGRSHILEASKTPDDETEQLTTKDIDDVFRKAFIYGVYEQKRLNKGSVKYGLTFPLNQSVVMSTLVLPYLPTFTPRQAELIVMKKTSWKNIRKFIKSLDKGNLVLSKEQGNEAVILDIDFEDPSFQDFTPYPLPRKDSGSGNYAEPSNSPNEPSDSAIGQRLKRLDLFRPRGSLIPLFKVFDSDASRYYTTGDIKASLIAYIEAETLISPTNKRIVKLNPQLSNAVFDGDSKIDKEVVAKGTCPRDALIDRIVQGCTNFHVILRGDETEIDPTKTKPKPGAAPKVQIVLETRSGNKTVTRVHGLETYFINPQPLADELRKVCAGSTSVEQFKGGKGMEVLVQGPQKDNVVKSLNKRGVLTQWIEALDKRKSK